jgi:hypothetical protein
MILQFYDFGEIGKFPFLSNVLATNISKNVVIIEIKKGLKICCEEECHMYKLH